MVITYGKTFNEGRAGIAMCHGRKRPPFLHDRRGSRGRVNDPYGQFAEKIIRQIDFFSGKRVFGKLTFGKLTGDIERLRYDMSKPDMSICMGKRSMRVGWA